MMLKAKVERVRFPREGVPGDWYILEMDTGAGTMTCKGPMRWRPEPGENLAMTGEFGEYKGQQEFKFKEVWHDIPQDSRSLLHYACELTKGCGPATEEAIWDALAEDWPRISSDQVPKMKGAVLNAFRDTITRLELEKEKTDACAWLIAQGATRNMAETAWAKWGEKTVGVVTGNCYKLADLTGYSFKDVDTDIRRRFGIEDMDARRIRAAVVYFMAQLADGPTAVPWWALKEKIIGATGLPLAHVNGVVAQMFKDGDLHPFAATQHIALRVDFENESMIWEYAKA